MHPQERQVYSVVSCESRGAALSYYKRRVFASVGDLLEFIVPKEKLPAVDPSENRKQYCPFESQNIQRQRLQSLLEAFEDIQDPEALRILQRDAIRTELKVSSNELQMLLGDAQVFRRILSCVHAIKFSGLGGEWSPYLMNNERICVLAEILPDIRGLRTLVLSDNEDIGSEGVLALAKALAGRHELRELHLYRIGELSCEARAAVLEAAKQNSVSLYI